MFEHSEKFQGGDRAVLVSLESQDTTQGDIQEFQDLVGAASVDALVLIKGKLIIPNQRFFLGTGKVEEVKQAVESLDANVVIVNHALSPSQNRNLERELKTRVVDRTALILDIFAQRAESFEGKLQVELAQLTHISTRLVRMWTHLDSLRGGSVGLRGPGETQLESDRRMIGNRIKQLKKKLEKVQKTRNQGNALRDRLGVPVVAFVGYTNAGKSSLFNQLTDAGTYVEDQLFATLDPKHRAIRFDNIGNIVLIDTVGFVSKLPHELVTAFHSTLRSATDADLLLEVIDVADDERTYKLQEVEKVLDEIGASRVPKIQIFNKIDLVDTIEPHVLRNDEGRVSAIWLSAEKNIGIDLLKDAIAEYFQNNHIHTYITLLPQMARLRAKLFQMDAIKSEKITEEGAFELEIFMDKREWNRLCKNDEDAKICFNQDILDAKKFENW